MRYLLVLLAFCCAAEAVELPVGVTNPNVTQANISATICKKGWATTVRPPKFYTSALKRVQMKAWKLTGSARDFEEDHYIPIELGGHPRAIGNLWPQLWLNGSCGAYVKDRSENLYNRKVCTGTMLLVAAQLEFSALWAQCRSVVPSSTMRRLKWRRQS